MTPIAFHCVSLSCILLHCKFVCTITPIDLISGYCVTIAQCLVTRWGFLNTSGTSMGTENEEEKERFYIMDSALHNKGQVKILIVSTLSFLKLFKLKKIK